MWKSIYSDSTALIINIHICLLESSDPVSRHKLKEESTNTKILDNNEKPDVHNSDLEVLCEASVASNELALVNSFPSSMDDLDLLPTKELAELANAELANSCGIQNFS